MPRSLATTPAETMLTSISTGLSTPVNAAAVIGLTLRLATSPAYSRRTLSGKLVSVSWPAKAPSCSVSLRYGMRRDASSAETDGKLTAFDIAPFKR